MAVSCCAGHIVFRIFAARISSMNLLKEKLSAYL